LWSSNGRFEPPDVNPKSGSSHWPAVSLHRLIRPALDHANVTPSYTPCGSRNLIQGDGVFIKPDIKLLLSSYGFSVHGQLSMAASGASVLPRIATSPPPITSTMPRTTNSVGGGSHTTQSINAVKTIVV